MRYKGIKGKFWTELSKAIRERDFKKYKRCVSCGKRVNSIKEFDAGHYIPAGNGGFSLRFDPKNIHGECRKCNRFDHGHLIGFRYGLIERYGEKFPENLEKRYKAHKQGKLTKEWTKLEWEREYKKLKENPQKYIDITLD